MDDHELLPQQLMHAAVAKKQVPLQIGAVLEHQLLGTPRQGLSNFGSLRGPTDDSAPGSNLKGPKLLSTAHL